MYVKLIISLNLNHAENEAAINVITLLKGFDFHL